MATFSDDRYKCFKWKKSCPELIFKISATILFNLTNQLVSTNTKTSQASFTSIFQVSQYFNAESIKYKTASSFIYDVGQIKSICQRYVFHWLERFYHVVLKTTLSQDMFNAKNLLSGKVLQNVNSLTTLCQWYTSLIHYKVTPSIFTRCRCWEHIPLL